MSTCIPVIIESNKYSPNADISLLKDVLAVNELLRFEALCTAYTLPLEDQNWFYYIVYDSGIFPVYDIFGISRDDITTIKNLYTYDYNPTPVALENFLFEILGENTECNIVYGTGELTITITIPTDASDDVTYDVGLNDLELWGATNEDVAIEVFLADYVINPQSVFILQNYIPAGVKLNIIFSSPMNNKILEKVQNKIGRKNG